MEIVSRVFKRKGDLPWRLDIKVKLEIFSSAPNVFWTKAKILNLVLSLEMLWNLPEEFAVNSKSKPKSKTLRFEGLNLF